MIFTTRSQPAINSSSNFNGAISAIKTQLFSHYQWTLSSSSFVFHFIILLILFVSPNLCLPTPKITDLIVNVGENVLLECSDLLQGENSYRTNSLTTKPQPFKYIWCRYEEDWVTGSTTAITGNEGRNNRNKNCFEGDRFFVASESKVSTVVYRCKTINKDSGQKLTTRLWKLYVDAFESVLAKRETMNSPRGPIVQQIERSPSDDHDFPSRSYFSPRLSPSSVHRCPPPRCKPYASVVSARCRRIELAIRYPTTQYGYNRSTDHWGTIDCGGGGSGDKDGEEGDKERGYFGGSYSENTPPPITGYQLWLIGYGIVKRFKPDDVIVIDNLVPGKRYCFNGWAVNRCGSGPVFTLEGVCAANTEDCGSSSDEHCELDVDYSY